jgi:hypothetical protein
VTIDTEIYIKNKSYKIKEIYDHHLHRKIESQKVVIQSQDERMKSQDEHIKSQDEHIKSQDELLIELETKVER